VFDLETRVHLQEVEALVGAAGDELDGAGAVVVHGAREATGLFAHGHARFLIEQRRWRLFDDFLVAALDRAFALEQMHNVAVLVAHHLDFDVARRW
jgi:hypothetical protein